MDTHPNISEQQFMELTEQEVQALKKLQEATELVNNSLHKTENTLNQMSNIDMTIEFENSNINDQSQQNEKLAQIQYLKTKAKEHSLYKVESERTHQFSLSYSVKGKPVRVWPNCLIKQKKIVEKENSFLAFLPFFYRKRFTLSPEERVRHSNFSMDDVYPLY